ncbi:hypothetical protein PT974_02461 [Cladobotryum mycophilum]|uniref:Myb-like DNA-binding domain-containing protein n=1 Tax=Cladobotryum mycophilum TaxID=491253 RepID=A0ABR0SY66_9HYPO
MSKQDPSEQVRFLVSCIGHTSNGRPDFAAVAEELGIVTKAAAQKRYERMLKANNVNASKPASKVSDGDEKPPMTPAKKRKTTAPTTGSAKKKTRGKATKTEDSDDEVKAPKSEDEDQKGAKKEECDDSALSGAYLKDPLLAALHG